MRANVTVSVTWESKPLVVWSLGDEQKEIFIKVIFIKGLVSTTHSHVRTHTCFVFFPTDFQGKERLITVKQKKNENLAPSLTASSVAR